MSLGSVVEDSDPAAVDAGDGIGWEGEAMVEESSYGSGEQAGEGSVTGGSLPEHAEEEGGEERGVDE